ncbi:MAG: OmpA family protein [gamma proteobacterium endosymbiont of Lamellibrachia anaximandri]|nr:OmpA family protein [gamma proteobacterium endosymbiont of Lamellibrachia anaximandri]
MDSTKKITMRLAALPFMLSAVVATPAYAVEDGFIHEPGKSVIHTNYGECWESNYYDAGFPIDPACYGDADGDGVVDPLDACPGTPKGTKVDEKGCALMKDSDGDGVTDDKDQCPGTPKGVTVDAAGCALDSDGDGVADYKDKCPGTPAGASVDANGCALDSDGDGVADYKDKCPGTPAGETVDSMGCSLDFTLVGHANFKLNSAELSDKAKMALDAVAAKILSHSRGSEVEVIGHTDSTGSAEYNQVLSERRARSAELYLESKGVPADQITSKGMGETQPVDDNGTKDGRYQNRRVEIDVK